MKNETGMAQSLDALVEDLQTALDKIDSAIAKMDGAELFDTLWFVREYGDLSDTQHRILFEKLERANATHSARSGNALDIYLQRPDTPYRATWQLSVMDGQVQVIGKEFATFEAGKAAGDALLEFFHIAGRAGQFEYETPRPDGPTPCADACDLPF